MEAPVVIHLPGGYECLDTDIQHVAVCHAACRIMNTCMAAM